MYSFTLGDAWGALPTLLAMSGFFVVALAVVWLVRWLIMWLFLWRNCRKRLALQSVETDKADGTIRKVWRELPHRTLGTYAHALIETLTVLGILTGLFFAAAIGGINMWQHSTSMSIISAIVIYAFTPGLQLWMAGYILRSTGKLALDEFWEVVGTGIGGRVEYIGMFEVELSAYDEEKQCAVFFTIPTLTVINGNLKRNPFRELHDPRVTMWSAPRHNSDRHWVGPTRGVPERAKEKDR
jgi:hypothetical protein